MSNETALTTQNTGTLEAINRHARYLEKKKDQITRWVMGGIKPEALIRFALHDLQNNEKLRDCDPLSIYLALLSCAVAGLEPGPLKGEAFLVPRNTKYTVNGVDTWRTECQFMLGAKGVQKQAYRSGIHIHTNVVRARDVFKMNLGSNQLIDHEPATSNPGEIIGAYAWAKLPKDGGLEIEWLNREDIEKIERASGGKSPAWKTWWDQMARKSACKRIGKRLPLGDDFFRATALDDANEIGDDASALLNEYTDGDLVKQIGAEVTDAAVFNAPHPPTGRTPEVNTKPEPKADAKPGSKTKPIEAKATERPTPAASTSSSAPNSGATETGTSSPSTSKSKLDEAKAAVEAKRPTTPAPAATPEPSSSTSPQDEPSSSTESVSTTPDTATSSSASPAESSDDFGGPYGEHRAPDLDGFKAWLAAAKCQDPDLVTDKRKWLDWCQATYKAGSEEAKEIQRMFAARKAELPLTRAP